MSNLTRRSLTKVAVLATAFSLALGVATSLPGDALALPKDPLYNTDDCTYAGDTYSEGSVVIMDDGKKYKCHDGHWDEASFQPPDAGFPGTVYQPVDERAPIYYNP